jgi:hypothetical protein
MLHLVHYEGRPVEDAPRHAIGLLDHTELPLPSLAECAEAIRLLCRRGLTYMIDLSIQRSIATYIASCRGRGANRWVTDCWSNRLHIGGS